jgi:hypothetical protein
VINVFANENEGSRVDVTVAARATAKPSQTFGET